MASDDVDGFESDDDEHPPTTITATYSNRASFGLKISNYIALKKHFFHSTILHNSPQVSTDVHNY